VQPSWVCEWPEGMQAVEEGRVQERMGSRDTEIRLSEAFTPLERVAISADGNLQRIVRCVCLACVYVGEREGMYVTRCVCVCCDAARTTTLR
jgi:hypothetical protein